MKTKMEMGDFVDPNIEQKGWNCPNYENDLANNGNSINKEIFSQGKKDSLKLTYQKDQI